MQDDDDQRARAVDSPLIEMFVILDNLIEKNISTMTMLMLGGK